eukprot:197073_1
MMLLLVLNLVILYRCNCEIIVGESTKYLIDDPLSKYQNDDYSEATPLLNIAGRVMDLMNGEHFDDILRDTPYPMRPPSIILFWDSTDPICSRKKEAFDFEDVVRFRLPSRAHLFASIYDMGVAPKRTWYKWIPERDLKTRFNVIQCPSLIWVSNQCNGFTDWCVNNTINGVQYLGCDDFTEQCTQDKRKIYDNNSDGIWFEWVQQLIETEPVELGHSNPSRIMSTMEEQEKWILKRDEVTTRTQLRNNWASSTLPGFSEKGYKAVKLPDILMKKMIKFYHSNKHQRRNENWNTEGTQVNGHEVDSYMVWMPEKWKDDIARTYIKPLLEQWVGFELQLTSFYGMREYYSGHFLRNHVDRMDVLIVSATVSIAKLLNDTSTDGEYNMWSVNHKWPLEGVDWKGNNVRYAHEPGTMVMYESAKFIHGRPYRMPASNYIHVGAFCHFIPADGSWTRLGHDKNARNNINRHTSNVYYKSEPPYYPPQNWKNMQKQRNKQDL